MEGELTGEDSLVTMEGLVTTLTEHHHPCTEPPCMEEAAEVSAAEEGRFSFDIFDIYHGNYH